MSKKWTIIFCIALVLTPCLALAGSSGSKLTPKGTTKTDGTDGVYNAIVDGYYKGKGNATVVNNTISITATVTDPAGQSGTLTISKLAVQGIHFNGSGTVMGTAITIRGRLDLPDNSDPNLPSTSRFFCTFRTSDWKMARVAGYVPVVDLGGAAKTNPVGGSSGSGSGSSGGASGGGGSSGGASPAPANPAPVNPPQPNPPTNGNGKGNNGNGLGNGGGNGSNGKSGNAPGRNRY